MVITTAQLHANRVIIRLLRGFKSSHCVGHLNSAGWVRSSHWRCSVKRVLLKSFTRKHLCGSLFLIKLQAFRAAILLRRDSNECFHVKFAKFLRTPFLKNIYNRLLLLRVGRLRRWEPLTMVLARNKAERIFSVKHSNKTTHHKHRHRPIFRWVCSQYEILYIF